MVASATSKLLEAAGLLVYVVVALLIGVGAAHCQTTSAERATIGGTMLRPDSDTTLRLQGLATSGGSDLLFLDAEGDVRQRLLAVGDLPAVVGRTDTANDWTALQTFSAGIALRDGTCSAGAGALYFTADTDTGLARSGGNAIVVCTGGSTRLTVNNTGTTAAGTLTSSGAFTASTTASVGSTLGVTGLATLTGGFSAGANSSVTGTFGVSGLATLTGGFAAGANSTITGNLTASGDVAVNGGDITSSAGTLNLDAGGIVQINDALVMASANTVRSSNFASRTTGWAITHAGEADFRYTYADEFYTKNFIADLETALNGGQVIAKSTVVVAVAFTCPAAGGTATLRVRDFPGHGNMRVFAANDWVVLRSLTRADADSDGNIEFSIADCVGQVTSYSDQSDDTQTWTFTRGSGGNAGAMASSTVVAADSLAIDYGVSGQGFLVARANDGTEGAQSPYWQVVTWTTSPVAGNMTPRTRWGNLNGAYGYSSNTYGIAFGDPSDVFCAAESTNGFRCLEGGSSEKFRVDPSGYVRVGQEGSGQLNTYVDPGVVALRVNTAPWVRLTTAGVELGQTSSGQGNTFIDTSGNYFARSGTVNRFTIAGSNGNSDWLDDDGTTVRARIGSTAAYFGSLAAERFQFTYGGALEAYNSAGTLYASLSAANGWLLGDWYSGAGAKGYAQITDRYFRLCKTAVGCALEFDGNTGDITSTGDILLSTGGNIESTGNFALNSTAGLLFADSSSATDYPRMVRWAGGSYMRGVGTALFLTTGIGSGGRSGAIAMQGSPSSGGEVAFTSHNGTSSSQASLQAHSSGASTLLVGSIIPSTGSSLVDGTATIGLSSARYDNINLALDVNSTPAFVIVNKGGGGADATSALGYIAGFSASSATTKVMGSCSVTIVSGIITNVTGC